MRGDAQALALVTRPHRRVQRAVPANNGPRVTEHLAQLCPPLATLFEPAHVHGSGHFGIRKPAPKVYILCLACLGVAARATLLVDDKTGYVEGAPAAGLHAFQFTGAAALRDAFSAHGLIRPEGPTQAAR